MKIALINENSQAAKNGLIEAALKKVVEPMGQNPWAMLKGAVAGEKFSELFFASCKDDALAAYIKTLL